jgi:hypothetical protein
MISWPEDLTNGALEQVLRRHYGDPNLRVLSASGNERFLATNDNFNSNITKISIVFKRSDEGDRFDSTFINIFDF